MSFEIIKTMKGDKNYHLFESVSRQLYHKDSQRWILGNDPKKPHLEGCYVLMDDNSPIGRLAFYENPALSYRKKSAATIGSYECVDDDKASEFLLGFAIKKSKNLGYHWLLGPMEGSTWNSYRFSIHNDYPNFFLEPYHHIYYNHQFKQSGFESIANYMTNLDCQIVVDREKLSSMAQKYEEKGLRIRSINMDDLNSELAKIGALSIEAFENNFLYTPISIDDFVNNFMLLGEYFDPDFILLVEDKQEVLQAIMFTIPDHLDPKKETIIVKSMARRADDNLRGIGYYLGAKILEIGLIKGYKKVKHAMIISHNASLGISKAYAGEQYKNYALYGIEL